MSLYGKMDTGDVQQNSGSGSLGSVLKWIFLYLGIATLVHWSLGVWSISRVWSYFATHNLTIIWQIRLGLGLASSLLFFGLMLWAMRGRSIAALTLLLFFSVAGLVCAIYAMSASPARMPDEPDAVKRIFFWASAVFRSRGMAIGWVISLVQIAGTRLTPTVLTVLDTVQYLLLIGVYILAFIKQPNAKSAH
jgi:hypothetical protein